MSVLQVIFLVLQILSSLFLIAVVLLQSGKRSGLSGAIAGAADTFLTRNKAKGWDSRLAKMTKWVAIGFIVLTLGLSILQ
jgi:preprotein translocase subunit SecG